MSIVRTQSHRAETLPERNCDAQGGFLPSTVMLGQHEGGLGYDAGVLLCLVILAQPTLGPPWLVHILLLPNPHVCVFSVHLLLCVRASILLVPLGDPQHLTLWYDKVSTSEMHEIAQIYALGFNVTISCYFYK